MKYLRNITPYTAMDVNSVVNHSGRKIASKAFIDSEHTEIRFFSFAGGETIDKEEYDKESIFWVLEGTLKVVYNETDEVIVEQGQMTALETGVNYGVEAITDCKVCNILVKSE